MARYPPADSPTVRMEERSAERPREESVKGRDLVIQVKRAVRSERMSVPVDSGRRR